MYQQPILNSDFFFQDIMLPTEIKINEIMPFFQNQHKIKFLFFIQNWTNLQHCIFVVFFTTLLMWPFKLGLVFMH